MRTTGFGAFFHPPTIIYDEGERERIPLTFVEGRMKPIPDHNVIENPVKRKIVCKYQTEDGFQIFVTEDGFVGIITALEKTAFEFLNVFFATLNTKFRKARYLAPEDITLFFWDESSAFLEISLIHTFSLRNLFHLKRDRKETFPDWEKWPKQGMGKLFINEMLGIAYRFFRNEQFKTDFDLIRDAVETMLDLRLSVSLLSSWLIIESKLMKIGHDMIKNNSMKLNPPQSWSTSYLIDEFFFQGKATKENKDCLTRLRKLRNDIVHDQKRDIVFEQAWNCLNVAIYMMYNQLNQTNPFEDVVYKELPYPNNS